MREWWSRRSEAQQAVTRMAMTTAYVAIVCGSLVIGVPLLLILALMVLPSFITNRIRARQPTSVVAQRQLLLDAFETLRIPPAADRELWHRWLTPSDTPESRRWTRVETIYGGTLGGGAVVASVTGFSWLVPTGAAVGAASGLLLDIWNRRRARVGKQRDSDREYLLAQLDALEHPRGS